MRGRLAGLPAAVWLWLVAMAACAALVARADFTADMSAFLPQAPTPEQRLLVDQLSDGLVSRLMLVGIEAADPGALVECDLPSHRVQVQTSATREAVLAQLTEAGYAPA